MNNTLNHGLCTDFEDGPDGDIAGDAQATWASVFIPPIQARLNAALPGANLSITQTINMMDLCPFNTVASANGTISAFCALFTEVEWHQYGYYETLNKYYGYSYGEQFEWRDPCLRHEMGSDDVLFQATLLGLPKVWVLRTSSSLG